MKNVPLTNFEQKVILDILEKQQLCKVKCYCGYEQDLCYKKKKMTGEYRCKLLKAITSIRSKLEDCNED